MRRFLVAGGRTSQGRMSDRPFPRFLVFAAAVLLSAMIPHSQAYNVSLESVTLFKRFSWYGTPSVYIECDFANRTYLPAVNSTLTWFTFQGNESWQVGGRVATCMHVVVAGMGIVIIIAACSVFLAAEPEAEAERVRLEGERAKFIEMGGGKSDGRPRFHDGYHYEGSEDEDKGEHKRHGQQHRSEFSGRFREEAGDVLSDIDEEDEEETTGLFPMHHTRSSAVPGAPKRAQPPLPVSSVPASVPAAAAAAAGTGIAAAGLTTTPTGAGGVRESPNLVEVSILQSPPGRPFEATPNPTTAAAYYHEW
ncbi:unnamed protein product [Closterium sp. NIES-53]